MNTISAYLFDNKKQAKEALWFQKALWLFLLYKCYVYSTHFNKLFSEQSFIYSKQASIGTLKDGAYFLTNHYSVWLSMMVIAIVAIVSLYGLLNRHYILTNIVLWFCVLNLNNYLYSTLTAGDHLLNQLLFFSIFLNTKNTSTIFSNDLKKVLHNMAFIGVKIQICLVYVMAALFKLQDVDWLHGDALLYIAQIPEYSNSFFSSLPSFSYTIMTYAVMFYQLTFPLVVFYFPFKKYIIAFGIIQHLAIAFCMGLFSFGVIMIICYIPFLKYDVVRNRQLT